MNEPNPSGGEPSISRQSFELVIRRALELSLADQEARDNVSEAELIKIAEELGLSARHVRQALYERSPAEEASATFLDRHFAGLNVVAVRTVPCTVEIAQGRLEDYLVTREYMQIRRRQGVNSLFEPADDAFSSIARAFGRSGNRVHIARAQRAYLTVRPLEAGWCHVRLELSYPEKRKSLVIAANVLGSMLALVTGSLVAGGTLATLGDGLLGVSIAATGGLAAASATFSGVWAAFRNGYRRWLVRGRDEADAVLDRLEHGDDLRPPASPWMRRLQQRLRGFGSWPTSS